MARKDKEVLFIFGDRHLPSNDIRIDSIIFKIVKDIKPDYLIDLGDGLDSDCLSNFDKTIDQLSGLQCQLDNDYIFREKLNKLAPKSKRILLECNHFSERLKKLTKKSHYWASDLRALTQRNLQKLDELDWGLREDFLYKDQMLFIHGDGGAVGSNKNPVNKVRSLLKENHISVVQGHSHCSGIEFHNVNGKICFAVQVGTGYDMRNKVKYIKNSQYMTNWSNSVLVVEYYKKENFIFPQLISIQNGICYFNGKLYKGGE